MTAADLRRRIVLLPGDGIGPEIVRAAKRLLEAVGEFEFSEHLVGGASIDEHGTGLTDDVLKACRGADAVLLGAVGGPKWDTTDPGAPRPEQGLLGLRKGMGLYANLRPVRPSLALVDASPLRPEVSTSGQAAAMATGPTTTACTRWPRSSASSASASRPRSGVVEIRPR